MERGSWRSIKAVNHTVSWYIYNVRDATALAGTALSQH